jgi:hypothetical protein
MGLPAVMLDMVVQTARQQRGGRACAAGYPDLLVRPEQLRRLMGEERAARVGTREDSAAILAWHALTDWTDEVFDSDDVFQELGYSLDVVDIKPVRGGEIIVDLNQPLPQELAAKFDLIVDTGTCEHCFNIAQAAINLASMLRPQGVIIQAMPLNSFNHGFYNVNPTWFHDFYPANGFGIRSLSGFTDVVRNPVRFEVPPFARFRDVPHNSIIVVVAQREIVKPMTYPTQRKYVVSPTLGGTTA